MELKITDDEFLGDTKTLLLPNEKYYPQEAWKVVRERLIEKF